MIGVNYKFGGNTPDGGLDCSGLVRYVFQQVTGVTLPRTSRELGRVGKKVAISDLMPGDLVFFNTRRFAFSHVGIYLGDNRFIHAPSKGSEVEIVKLTDAYWRKHFNGARRLVGALPGLMIPSANASPVEATELIPVAAQLTAPHPAEAQ
ncbi:MAG: C40 family peptidase [Betaproteobacteria bacterium]|nr:C40 family peptidase [Betaproteobacteria bacterium]